MLEIGSEFWKAEVIEQKNDKFSDMTKWFLSGQNALNYIISDIKLKYNVQTVALPSWCCDSMIIPFLINDFIVDFYSVVIEDGCLKQKMEKKSDVILVMDYFGFSTDYDFSVYQGIVIRDITHSLFAKNYQDADYFFGSLRKWTGICTGGYAWCKGTWSENNPVNETDNRYVSIRKKAMIEKSTFINGNQSNKFYLATFKAAEDLLDEDNLQGIYKAWDKDIEVASKLDIDLIKSQRRKNAQRLLEELSELALFKKIGEDDCPLFIPILVEKRDELKEYLINNHIYCPCHWPISKYHKLNDETRSLYDRELSLVCDQRYSEADMNRMISLILDWRKNN